MALPITENRIEDALTHLGIIVTWGNCNAITPQDCKRISRWCKEARDVIKELAYGQNTGAQVRGVSKGIRVD